MTSEYQTENTSNVKIFNKKKYFLFNEDSYLIFNLSDVYVKLLQWLHGKQQQRIRKTKRTLRDWGFWVTEWARDKQVNRGASPPKTLTWMSSCKRIRICSWFSFAPINRCNVSSFPDILGNTHYVNSPRAEDRGFIPSSSPGSLYEEKKRIRIKPSKKEPNPFSDPDWP